MPYSVKYFRNVAEDDFYFFAGIKSLNKGIVKIIELINDTYSTAAERGSVFYWINDPYWCNMLKKQ